MNKFPKNQQLFTIKPVTDTYVLLIFVQERDFNKVPTAFVLLIFNEECKCSIYRLICITNLEPYH